GSSGAGIQVWSGPAATDLTVAAADVTGTYGIHAQNGGTGATSITATGILTGSEQTGLLAHNGAMAGDLSVTVADVSGVLYGIGVANGSMAAVPGDTTVTTSGTVSGDYAGIFAVNGGVDPADFASGNLGLLGPGGHDLTI